MRFFWVLGLLLIFEGSANTQLGISDISDQEVTELIQTLKGKKLIYDFLSGPDKEHAENSGSAEISFTLDEKNNEITETSAMSVLDENGKTAKHHEFRVFSARPPFDFKRAGTSDSLTDGNKPLSFESARIEVRNGKLFRSKSTKSESSSGEIVQSEHTADLSKLTFKHGFIDWLLARKNPKNGTELHINLINSDDLSSVEDEIFLKSLTPQEIIYTSEKKPNCNFVTVTDFSITPEGYLDKDSTCFNLNGIPDSKILNEEPFYTMLKISTAKESRGLEIKKPNYNFHIDEPNKEKNNLILEQLKNGRVVFKIPEGSKVPPAGHDQLISANEVILEKNIGTPALQQQPVITSDLSHESDSEIPDYVLNPVLKTLKEFPALKESPIAITQMIQEQVHKYITYQKTNGNLSLTDVFKVKKGDCNNLASIYASIFRKLGIPSHVSTGYAYSPNDLDAVGHAWVEAKIGGKWIGIEATVSSSSKFFIEDSKDLYLKLANTPSNSNIKDDSIIIKMLNGYDLRVPEGSSQSKTSH